MVDMGAGVNVVISRQRCSTPLDHSSFLPALMKSAVLSCLATVAVVGAHNIGPIYARQASSAVSAPASPSVGTSAGSAPPATQTSFSFTLAATNPTAIPLGQRPEIQLDITRILIIF